MTCAKAFGFQPSRITGDHYIYVHPDVPELVNLQNIDGKAKPYQVKQLLQIIERHNLQIEDEESKTIISTYSTVNKMKATLLTYLI